MKAPPVERVGRLFSIAMVRESPNYFGVSYGFLIQNLAKPNKNIKTPAVE